MIYDPANVEEELLRVQRNVSPSEARTSLFNLVVFSTEKTRRLADEAVGHLLGRRPARVLQVRPSSDGESDIHVSARCLLDDQNQSVCIQEIIIDAANRSGTPGLWSPLLIRDIPVYVLWLDSVAERKDELLLAWEQADKIIVDSGLRPEINTDTTRFFPTLLGIHRNQDVLFADLAWQRVTPLREAVATLFDTEEDLPRLGDITSVELARVPRAEAYLIQYWLASRLNWETDTRGFRDATGREVAVAVGEESEVDINRAFVSLGTADGEEYTASADGSGCIHLTRPNAEEQETRVYTVPAAGEALLNEVDDVKVDQVYLETVSLLASTSAV